MRIERLSLAGPAGPLEALLEFDPNSTPGASAVVCHPHPLYGGTMHNKVVFRVAKATLSLGMPTLRFNFRGVGKSAGNYDEAWRAFSRIFGMAARVETISAPRSLENGGGCSNR